MFELNKKKIKNYTNLGLIKNFICNFRDSEKII